jgi:hypothetical protein
VQKKGRMRKKTGGNMFEVGQAKGGKEEMGVPPSQEAIRVCESRMGSHSIISIALRGCGWKSMIVCSKRGPLCALGLGRWLVDHGFG